MEIKFHQIRGVLELKLAKLDNVRMDDNGTNMMTKPLTKEKLDVCRRIAYMIGDSK